MKFCSAVAFANKVCKVCVLRFFKTKINDFNAPYDEDYDKIKSLTWHATLNRNTWYAKSRYKGKVIRMHRFILGLVVDKPHIDHKDRNGLNNQRSNLRPSP